MVSSQVILRVLGNAVIRFMEGVGRSLAAGPQHQYLDMLKDRIDARLRWAPSQPNGEDLWERVAQTVEDILRTEWQAGRLQGAQADDAFFARCDRGTMTQEDIDNRRVVCMVGVALVRSGEYTLFTIEQKAA
ncbi:MAG: hypothetical protein M1434_14850 [Chloroflexi bacterium]|nr:hypothetical protein [Chloroflexota bacterium]MCL5275998.1 hypothetical protein [Chloroflexota bacterium]